MTTNPKIVIHDTATDEYIEREMTDTEAAEYERAKTAYVNKQTKAEASKAALLAKLGITAEEAQLLLGGTN